VQHASPGDETPRLPAGTRIGHFHLQVGDVDHAATWWQDVPGTDITHRRPGARFLSWGGYRHHIGLNAWISAGAGPRDPDVTGLEAMTFAIRDGSDFDRLARPLGAAADATEFQAREPFGISVSFRRL